MAKKDKLKSANIDINRIAKLANIPLSAQEKSIYEQQLSKILDYVELVESVDTKSVKSTFNVSTNKNVTRKEKVNKGLTQDEALANVVNKKNGFVVTKGVFEEE